MKKTILSAKQGELLETLIAKYGQVVTADQIHVEATGTWGYQQTKNRISQLVKHGWLIRIKRGLYAISDLSSRGFLSVSPYAVAHLLVQGSYVSFEAALAYHGMFDQFTDQFVSVSLTQFQTVQLNSIQYRFIKAKKELYFGWQEAMIDNMAAHIATAEKALVDMVHFRKSKYAVDLMIEKLQDYQDSLDVDRLYEYLGQASLLTVKVFGLVFDLLNRNSDRLYNQVIDKKSTHRMSSEDQTFNAKWRLYYDEYFDKYQIN